MFEDAIRTISDADRIIIHRHRNPDGDALGSQLGLLHIIRENFPGKEVYAVGDAAGRFSFMDGSVMDDIPDSLYSGALAVILDTSARALISDDRYTLASHTLRIDHHIFVEKIADCEVVDTSAESCCGLIVSLAAECGLRLNRDAATALFTGMVTDSGRFRYDSVTPDTFRRAALLLEHDADAGAIYSDLYADDFDMIRLRASFVMKIRFTANRVAYIYTDAAEMRDYRVSTFTISRGMVNTMSDIRGVGIWVNFTETDAGVLCEIRSSGKNINPVAVKYGGGGHAKASGATLTDRAQAMLLLADLDEMAGECDE